MEVSEIQLFQILREKVGDEQAKSLAEYVETKIEKQFDLKKDVLATKQDLNEKLRFAEIRSELLIEISKSKIETIKLLFYLVICLVIMMFIIAKYW